MGIIEKIKKHLAKIEKIDAKIARIKSGKDKKTNEKKEKFVNELYKTINIDNFINDVDKIIAKNK